MILKKALNIWIFFFYKFHFLISKETSNHILKHVMDKHKEKKL